MRHFPLIVLAAAMITSPAFASPTQTGAWNGSTAYIMSNTESSPRYRCAYQVTVTFTDGTTYSTKGTTDPATGMTNGHALTLQLTKTITNVTVNSWQCSPI